MTITKRAGYDIFERALGEGMRRALLLHCSLAHSGAWRGLAGALGDEFRLTAYDHLDHGKSANWNREGDYHTANTAVAETFLGDEPIDLIGHSFGATVALRLAVMHPDRVRSLVLIEPVLFAVAVADTPEFSAEHDAEISEMARLIAAGDKAGAARAFLAEWGGGGPPWEAMPEEMRSAMAERIHVITDAQPQLYHDEAGLLAEGVLDALQMPVLLLRGSVSPDVIGVINEGLARRIKGAKSAVIEGAGHMAPITHAKACADQIRAFYGL